MNFLYFKNCGKPPTTQLLNSLPFTICIKHATSRFHCEFLYRPLMLCLSPTILDIILETIPANIVSLKHISQNKFRPPPPPSPPPLPPLPSPPLPSPPPLPPLPLSMLGTVAKQRLVIYPNISSILGWGEGQSVS